MLDYFLFWLAKMFAEFAVFLGFLLLIAVLAVVLAVYGAKQQARRNRASKGDR